MALADSMRRLGKPVQTLWALSTFYRQRDVAKFYEAYGDDVVYGEDDAFSDSQKALWLNFGYWGAAKTYPDACVALADRLAEAGRLRDQEILDVGFGYAEQDAHWVRAHGVQRITGINITPLHVQIASQRIAHLGLAAKIRLQLGSATDLDFEPGSFDRVVALESAFHFDPREAFFEQACSVLRPGGRIALADFAPMPGSKTPGVLDRAVLRALAIPEANFYDRHAYSEKLRRAGFVDVEIESIRNNVFPGMSRYMKMRRSGLSMSEAVVELSDEDIAHCRGVEDWDRFGGMNDYLIVTANKPV